jgi:hypothetical protein
METQSGASESQGFSKVAELRPDTLDHCLQVKVCAALVLCL